MHRSGLYTSTGMYQNSFGLGGGRGRSMIGTKPSTSPLKLRNRGSGNKHVRRTGQVIPDVDLAHFSPKSEGQSSPSFFLILKSGKAVMTAESKVRHSPVHSLHYGQFRERSRSKHAHANRNGAETTREQDDQHKRMGIENAPHGRMLGEIATAKWMVEMVKFRILISTRKRVVQMLSAQHRA